MKKILSCLVCMLFLFNIVPTDYIVHAAEQPLTFADSNLNNAFDDFIGVPHGTPVYLSQINTKEQQILSTDSHGFNYDFTIPSNVTNLSGIEALKDLTYNIRSIYIQGDISDLTPLQALPISKLCIVGDNNSFTVFNGSNTLDNSLQVLDIENGTADNIIPLSNLKSLTSLIIKGTQTSDISPIANLNTLKSVLLDGLNQWGSPKVDISLLKNLPALNKLTLARLNLTSSDFSTFATDFKALNMLEVYNEPCIKDISYLKNKINLINLTLRDCGLDNTCFDTITTLTNLVILDLCNNSITDIEPLRSMINLKNLALADNMIENIDAIGNLSNLTQVSLDTNYITDITPLTKLTHLLSADIHYNFIDIFNTQKTNLDNIKTSWDVTSKPQRAVDDIPEIDMNVGDSIWLYNTDSIVYEEIPGGTNKTYAEVKETSDGSSFSMYHYMSYGKFNFNAEDNSMLNITADNNPGMSHITIDAVAPGTTYIDTLFRNNNSPLMTGKIKVVITGTVQTKGSITIKYQDENGTDIQTPDVLSNLDLGSYKENAKSFPGYSLNDSTSKTVTLTDSKPNQTITFSYRKIKGSITIKYQDENGTDIQAPDVLSNLDLGTYTEKAKIILGYNLHDALSKSVTLTDSKPSQTITFSYSKIKGSITIKYQDENGTDIQASNVLSNLDMGIYTEAAKTITGYELNDTITKVVILDDVNPNKTIIFNYKLIKGTIEGYVKDVNGKPLNGVKIELQDEKKSTLTDNTGYYKFSGVDLGNHTVRILSADYKPIKEIKVSINLDNNGNPVTKIVSNIDNASQDLNLSQENNKKEVDFVLIPTDEEPAELLPHTGNPANTDSLSFFGILMTIIGGFLVKFKFKR